MARPKKYKLADIVDALQKAHGLKTGAAELMACSFTTIDKFCNEHAEAQAVVDHWKRRRKDRSEYRLDEAIERGEAWAIMFTLKPARDREYSDRITVVHDSDIDAEVARVLAELASRGQAALPGEAPLSLDAGTE